MKRFNNWSNNRPPPRRSHFSRPPTKFDPRIDNSREILASFTFRTVRAEQGEDNERLMRRFKRVVEGAGVLAEIKRREAYKSPGEKRREREMKSIKNARKRQAKLDRMTDYDSKKINVRPPSDRRGGYNGGNRRPYNQAPVTTTEPGTVAE